MRSFCKPIALWLSALLSLSLLAGCDRNTGEYTIFKDSIIRDKPRQTTISEDDTSHSFTFAVESFNVSEKVVDDDED